MCSKINNSLNCSALDDLRMIHFYPLFQNKRANSLIARGFVLTCLVFLFIVHDLFAQSKNDTLVLNNKDMIVGEIKSMQRGVLTVETDYSDKDFQIEFDKILEVYTDNYFYLTLKNGQHYYGWLKTSDSMVNIITRDSAVIATHLNDIVSVMSLNKGFKSRFDAEIDIGLGLAKSNNLRQLTGSAKTGYKAENWILSLSGNTLNSIQDDVDPITRAEGKLAFQLIIYKDWYFIPEVNYLNSSELKLNSRWNILLGIGNYIIRTNYLYWGLNAGVNWNFEDYYQNPDNRRSWEGNLGTELNLFDIGDLDLYCKLGAYKGITDADRWRFDGDFNMKYDLPLDFYVKIEFILNYDNMPLEQNSKIDYVSTIGFGWEWDID